MRDFHDIIRTCLPIIEVLMCCYKRNPVSNLALAGVANSRANYVVWSYTCMSDCLHSGYMPDVMWETVLHFPQNVQ